MQKNKKVFGKKTKKKKKKTKDFKPNREENIFFTNKKIIISHNKIKKGDQPLKK